MTPRDIALSSFVASLAFGLFAGFLVSGAALKLRAKLLSARWFLIWFIATLFTLVGSIVVSHVVVNWNNPNTIAHVFVDPGPLEKAFPLLAVFLGAVGGGWLASRKAKPASVLAP